MRRSWSLSVVAGIVALVLCAGSCGRTSEYPSRPITMVVPWGAGGGTDSVARIMASLMERELGVPVNVLNRTGGSGVVGHQQIATSAPDGYTVGIVTVEIAMMHHQGLTDLAPDAFTPLGLINFDATAVQVRNDAPYKTLGELVAAIRTSPAGTFKASGTAHGGIWHVSLYGFLDEQNIAPATVTWVPSVSSSAGLLDLVAGGIDLVTASHPESRSLIDGGLVRSLAILDASPSALYPDVPTGQSAIGTNWQMGVWRGIAAPKNLPADTQSRLQTAVKNAYDSAEFRDFMTKFGFGMRWAGPDEFAQFMAESDAQMGVIMKKVGLAK